MLNLSSRQQTVIAVVAMVIMALTRSHHVAGLNWLPDASTALFFLAGFYLGPVLWFAVLLGEAALVDYAAVTWGGVSDFCVTPAYGFLIPAYAALWGAGRWYSRRHQLSWSNLPMLVAAVLVGGFVAELISNGSFYLLAGYVTDHSWNAFASGLFTYLPYSMQALALYVGLAALVHVAIMTSVDRDRRIHNA
ncbi:MAG: hypothetical protein H6981_00845 [Gammaproteobacteria bacterium]|nr:hypothetical protein [Gammaproteobacteria bacterium]MCP5135335.1 hypothetical protein [Gammaproteobacteria bacterium]